MFRPVRRIKNALGEEATKEILRSARRGVLAVNGDGGNYPDKPYERYDGDDY